VEGKETVELEKAFRLSAETDIAYMSGILRVTIEHNVNFFRLSLDGVLFSFFALGETHSWGKKALFSRALMVFVSIAAVADLVYQMTGSETIEFSPDGLRIRTKYLGFERDRQHPLVKCNELSWQRDDDQKSHCALECKVGWRKIRFGRYLSETQAWEVLSELQRYLPDVAQKMGMSSGSNESHITRLGLN